MRAHPNLRNVNFDWNDRVKSVRVEIDQLGHIENAVAEEPASVGAN